MMPPPLRLSDNHCKYFRTGVVVENKKGATNKQTNEGVCVSCSKILYNSLTNENKIALKFLKYLHEIC